LFPGCDRQLDPIEQAQSALDSADQVMMGLKQYLTQEGIRQAYLEADTAYIYETRGHIALRNIRVTFFGTNGEQTSVLTARRGVHNIRTELMEAMDDVVVVRTDGGRLTTNHLIYDKPRNEVKTDSAYTYTTPERTMSGDGFVSDPSFQNITSQNIRGRAGGFRLPSR
jgi:LPS export ABC transporter protein LptC